MLKAGFIGAGIGFLLGIVVSLVAVCLNPFVALMLGLGVGFFAAVLERPMSFGASADRGAKAGGIAAMGNLVGHAVGVTIHGLLTAGFEKYEIVKAAGEPVYITPWQYWTGLGGVNCLCAVMDVAIGTGLGAVGGLLGCWLAGTGRS